MELSDYLRILRQRGWVIVLVALLTAVSAFGYSKAQTPVYESAVKLLVQPERTDFGQASAAKVLLDTNVAWLTSRKRAQDVIDILQLDMEAGELLGDMKAASESISFVIQLSVENSDDKLANDIARTWGELLVQRQQQRNAENRKEDRIAIEFIDDPQISGVKPKWKINTAAGAVFGALLGVIVIFILEWIESGIIRRSEDVERFLDIPVIGSIPSN